MNFPMRLSRFPVAAFLSLLVTAALGAILAGPAVAQAPTEGRSVFDRLQQLKEEGHIGGLPVSVLRWQAERDPGALSPEQRQRVRALPRQRGPATGAPMANVADEPDLEIRDPQASFNEKPWPRSDLNFLPNNLAEPAGDVNGDGTNDWVYRYTDVADNRTSDPSSRTDKTLLAFGGGDFSARYFDELIFGDLEPVGPFIGDDDRADAIETTTEGDLIVYEGTEEGYEELGTLPGDFSGPVPRESADLDGDGFDDLVLFAEFGTTVVAFGAASLDGIETKTFDSAPRFGFSQADVTATDITGDGTDELVGFSGTDGVVGTVLEIDSGREISTELEFDMLGPDSNQVGSFGFDPTLATIDVDASGTPELLVESEEFSDVLVYAAEEGTYDGVVPLTYRSGITHVGDLNGDGRADFAFRKADGNPFIGLGPATLEDGLGEDVPFAEDLALNDEESISFGESESFDRRFGNLTGDGQDDFIAQVTMENQFGTRLIQVVDDESEAGETDFRFDASEYQGDLFQVAKNVGDWNGDGTDDLALVFSDFSVFSDFPAEPRVEIYFGDPTKTAPDLTFTREEGFPRVATGDFTGNGERNLAVGWNSDPGLLEIFESGQGTVPIASFTSQDLLSEDDTARPVITNVGDVNADGSDDLAIAFSTSSFESTRTYLLLESLSPPADVTIDYGNAPNVSRYVGGKMQGLGDVNGDGIDDFAIGDTRRTVETDQGSVSGGIYVHFGESGDDPAFDSGGDNPANVVIEPQPQGPSDVLRLFPWGMATADVTGNGQLDLVAKPPSEALFVYEGGESFDDVTDASAPIPSFLDPTADGEQAVSNFGELTAVPPAPESDAPRLMVGTLLGGNALIYEATTEGELEPSILLRGPDQSAGLGSGTVFFNRRTVSSGIGDFLGDGEPAAFLPQIGSTSFLGTPGYRFGFGEPAGGREDEDPVAADMVRIDSSNIDPGDAVEFGDTGTSIAFSEGTEGSGEVSVQRFDSAPDGAAGIQQKNLSPFRFEISVASGDLSVGDSSEVRFEVSALSGIDDPSQVTIVTREVPGIGSFTELETQVDDKGTPSDLSDDEIFAFVSGFSEFAFVSDTEALPVEMASFEGRVTNRGVRLTWQTASEENNAGFEVQRRTDGVGEPEWTEVGFVESKAKGGTTSESQSYRYVDADLPFAADRLEYRLQQVDLDGAETLTDPVEVERSVDRLELRKAFPNPAESQTTVQFAVPERQDVRLQLYDVLGRQVRAVRQDEVEEGREEIQVDLSGLASGTYFLRLRAEGETETQRLTVVR